MSRFLLAAALLCCVSPLRAESELAPSKDRVAEIAALLPDAPTGVGRPITDRDAWDQVADHPAFESIIADAEKLAETPMPPLTDEALLDFSKTGNRSRGQRVLSLRHRYVPTLVMAECMENKGRFLPAIEDAVRETCGERMWNLPAHDRSLDNFHDRARDVDLGVVAVGWNLATADYWLGDRLSNETRALIRRTLERYVFTPITKTLETGEPRHWWMTGTNNWNAVCWAGVVGTAMAVIDDRDRRAYFAAAAEDHIDYFLSGFTADGYCSEGMGYWNYGFGNYVKLAETLHQATDGRMDLFQPPLVREIALFGPRMEIAPGVYAAFADCKPNTHPSGPLMAFLSKKYALGMKDLEKRELLLASGPPSALYDMGVFGFPNSATEGPAIGSGGRDQSLRDWFKDAGILICRPGPDGRIAVALKGGHNGEHHNHNDIGSYVVAIGGGTPLLDVGGEVYTARTFSSKRYESDVLNSFGHPVPVVNGQLQKTGRDAKGVVIEKLTEFTDDADHLHLDLTSAYNVPELKKLERGFAYERGDSPGLVVADEAQFSEPCAFETALMTFSPWRRIDDTRLLIGEGDRAVIVEIMVFADCEWTLKSEAIDEDVSNRDKPTRLGIVLDKPVMEALIVIGIYPSPINVDKDRLTSHVPR